MTPMLAGKADLAKQKYPVYVSPKLDGIRALIIDGVVMSRKLIAIPNKAVQAKFGHPEFSGLDGELIVGCPRSPTVMRDTTSVVMSHDKPADDVTFHVFDHVTQGAGWLERFEAAAMLVQAAWGAGVKIEESGGCGLTIVKHTKMHAEAALLELDAQHVAQGYEGSMLRSHNGPYKHGRSTTNEGYLLKLKQFEDAEAEIIGFEELMHNANEATRDNVGRTKRSSAKDGKVGLGRLGALVLRRPDGIEFNCGTGFDDIERIKIWLHRDMYIGKLAKYRFFPSGGKYKPRFPTYLGIRHTMDT